LAGQEPLETLRQRLGARLSHLGKWVGVPGLIGFASGVAAVVFDRLLIGFTALVFGQTLGHESEGLGAGPPERRLWILVLLPLGGLLVGWLTQRFAPEARGHGTEQLIKSFHQLGGKVRRRVIALKALASTITIGTGGSAGAEGPVTQIGSGIGSATSDLLGLPERDRRMFLLAGSSAGVGALFSAPLGGALFAPEVLYRKPEFEGEAIVPCILASIVAYTTFTTIEGDHRRVFIPNAIEEKLALHDPRELLLYLLLAVLCALVSWAYVKCFSGTGKLFARLTRVPPILRPALGGLGVALLALALAPHAGDAGVLFGGYRLMEAAIHEQLPVRILALLIGAKIVATSLTISSGGSGGVFAPSLALGALCGALIGEWADALFPALGIEPACFALVGMGGFFAGVAKTPIAAIVIVCEMTGSYGLLAPLMLVAVVHLLLAHRYTIYETQVNSLVDSPAHAGDFAVDVLEEAHVRDLLPGAPAPELVRDTATLRACLDFIATARGYYFPVVDAESRMVGIISLSDVRRIFRAAEVADMVIVRDFMIEKVVTTTPDEDLNTTLHKLNEHGLHEIPVVDPADPRRVLAMLTRHQLGAAYQQRLRELRGA
jgi:CIC family chloride channel protein